MMRFGREERKESLLLLIDRYDEVFLAENVDLGRPFTNTLIPLLFTGWRSTIEKWGNSE